MEKILTVVQVVFAVGLIGLILLQNKGGGLSGVFGGSEVSNVYRTKRGMEKNLFLLTIIFTILFLGASLANILLRA
ncbi:preprotein translocase subunit SecG [Candidatus Falkowbacteria bacterium RIFOXYC2_FULL_48_21]|uniref:Protein-export membrane protein SecG n=1 Tax=Candidatus Falkowbacteria bacterium RIFOXYC2_FULL_48_21 TaxID=1798005 RepID=A0A1F5TGT0_9BACT|nr:MAG: preprotein translocase subunit SecG [Candidatus Falkowbacteria bacterium RIFOXYC2_FULL_48_21]